MHNFSLVHDDLPALDNDELRRGRPSTWAALRRGGGVLAGDALLAEALRLALSYPSPAVARELVQATLGMIGGQYLDIKGGGDDLAALHRLKTGCLFSASVAMRALGGRGAGVAAEAVACLRGRGRPALPDRGRHPRRGRLRARARRGGGAALADEAAERARRALSEVDADTSVLEGIVDELAVRTS